MYIYNDHEVYYLSSGSNPKYNAYMGAYRLQWEMIKFAKNITLIDIISMVLLGTLVKMLKMQVFKSSKEGFNADVYEYIGDFIKPIKPIFYKVKETLENRK